MTGKKMLIIIAGSIVLLLLIVWTGLQIQPASFGRFPRSNATMETIPIPDGLPEPVYRFYRTIYPAGVPIIGSAVISGRATLRIKGITLPARFRFTHDTGKGYRHYIEVTWFGIPVMKINEHYLDGKCRLDLPFGVTENSPRVDQAANLALWAESIWLPGILLSDPRVRWEPVDSSMALLAVPFGSITERFVARFDPTTSLLFLTESMRYKEAASENRILWLNQTDEWIDVAGYRLPTVGIVTWLDEGTPWATFRVEDVVYNADVREYIRAGGE